jgi:Domain of unknown function (DUF4157)
VARNYLVDRQQARDPGGGSARAHDASAVGKRTLTMDLPPVQRKSEPSGAGAVPNAPPAMPSPGDGAPMPAGVRSRMENAFGTDFSAVRIHQGLHASALGALGYTQGNDIHFAPGQYQPDARQGQELLGHELAHVVQQSQGRVHAPGQAKGLPINDDQGLEREADEAGSRAARGEPAGIGSGGAAGGHAIQMSPGETIQRLIVALGVGAAVAGTLYYLLPMSITMLLVTGGLVALPEYWYGVVAGQLGISTQKDDEEDSEKERERQQRGKQQEEGKHDGKNEESETGGLGLGFGDLYEHEDAFGHVGQKGKKVKGNLGEFRTKLKLTSLAPPLEEKQRNAASSLCKYLSLMELKKLDEATVEEIGKFGVKEAKLVDALAKVQQAGLTNLQISEFCGCYLRVIETLIGGDGSVEVKRELSEDVDDGKPSSLSASIVNAMYREKAIRSNLAGFSNEQIDWARKTSPVLPAKLADEARSVDPSTKGLRNDDCNLWNVMNQTSAKWSVAAVQISVWELATIIHTPELAQKTQFYNYNITDKSPSTEPLDKEWVFTGMKK